MKNFILFIAALFMCSSASADDYWFFISPSDQSGATWDDDKGLSKRGDCVAAVRDNPGYYPGSEEVKNYVILKFSGIDEQKAIELCEQPYTEKKEVQKVVEVRSDVWVDEVEKAKTIILEKFIAEPQVVESRTDTITKVTTADKTRISEEVGVPASELSDVTEDYKKTNSIPKSAKVYEYEIDIKKVSGTAIEEKPIAQRTKDFSQIIGDLNPGVYDEKIKIEDANKFIRDKTDQDISKYKRQQWFYANVQRPVEIAFKKIDEYAFVKNAWAVTTVTKTVKSSGGDYTSIVTCEDTEDGDFVSGDTQKTCEVYGSAWSLSQRVTVDGSTTDATRYFKFTVESASRHNGTYSTGFLLESTADYNPGPVTIADPYTVWEGFRLRWSALSSNKLVDISANNVTLRYNVMQLEAGGGGSKWVVDANASTNVYIYRNVVQDRCDGGVGTSSYSTPSVYIYGNTIECGANGTGIKYSGASNTGAAKNNIVCNASTDFSFASGVTHTNNASNSTGGEIDNIVCADQFSDYAGNNFNLVSGATSLIDAGASLGSPYDDNDIKGTSISGSVDVGAFEYVSAATDTYSGRGISRGISRGVMR